MNAITADLRNLLCQHLIDAYEYSLILYHVMPTWDVPGQPIESEGAGRRRIGFTSPEPGLLVSDTSHTLQYTAGEDWGQVTGIGIMDQNELVHWVGLLPAPIEITRGAQLSFPPGSIVLTLS